MRQDYVVGFAFSADKSKVVLIRKNRPAWQAGKLNGPGGKIEHGETPHEAMCREFAEECGVETTPEDWHYFTKIVGDKGDVFFYRMFDDKALNAITKLDEDVVIVDTDLNYLQKDGLSNIVWLIAIALDEMLPNFFVEANYNQEFVTGQITKKTGTN
jgi:8-oxo-dGTP diphosphatase